MRTPTVLATRIRRAAAAWRRSGDRAGTARVTEIRCPYCRQWRSARSFRRGARGCRKCIGNG